MKIVKLLFGAALVSWLVPGLIQSHVFSSYVG